MFKTYVQRIKKLYLVVKKLYRGMYDSKVFSEHLEFKFL